MEWAGIYWLVLFQLLAGIVLLRQPGADRFAWRILAALFFLNAAITAIMTHQALEGGTWLPSAQDAVTRTFRALDAPTGPFLLALAFALRGGDRNRTIAMGLLVAGIVLGLLELPFGRFLAWHDHYLRALPFYAGLAASVWVLAGGSGWRRWVAIALLPRALYWGTAGVVEVTSEGLGGEPAEFVNRLGLLALAAVSLAASIRLLRGADQPPAGIALTVLAVGPLAVAVEAAVRAAYPPEEFFRFGIVVVLNLLTLAIIRPAFTIIGVAPWLFGPILLRATVASVVGGLSVLVLRPTVQGTMESGLEATVLFGTGLAVACIVIGVHEGIRPIVPTHEPSPPKYPAGPGGPARAATPLPVGAPPARTASAQPLREMPQWQRLLVELRGSGTPSSGESIDATAYTQKAIVAHTGISAPRISRLVSQLNEAAPARLDVYLPGWRDLPDEAKNPALIQRFDGAIAGAPGARVYYRLTRMGELLADVVARSGETSDDAGDREGPGAD